MLTANNWYEKSLHHPTQTHTLTIHTHVWIANKTSLHQLLSFHIYPCYTSLSFNQGLDSCNHMKPCYVLKHSDDWCSQVVCHSIMCNLCRNRDDQPSILCICPTSECLVPGERWPGSPTMHGADCAGLDPLGIPLALCSMAPGVAMQRSTGEGKTSVQDLPLQTGKSHNKENVGHKKWKRFILKVWEFCHTDNDLPQRNFF